MFEYHLSQDDITLALEKGSQRAHQIIESSDSIDRLKDQFDRVIWCTDHLLENFGKVEFKRRNNARLSHERLRRLILDSFKSVQTLTEIAPHLKPPRKNVAIDSAVEVTQYVRLLSATTMFRTNGANDDPAFDIIPIIKNYTTQSLQAA